MKELCAGHRGTWDAYIQVSAPCSECCNSQCIFISWNTQRKRGFRTPTPGKPDLASLGRGAGRGSAGSGEGPAGIPRRKGPRGAWRQRPGSYKGGRGGAASRRGRTTASDRDNDGAVSRLLQAGASILGVRGCRQGLTPGSAGPHAAPGLSRVALGNKDVEATW